MKCPFIIKKCSECKELLVAYKGNFYKDKASKYGFKGKCKKCTKEYSKEYSKKYYQINKEYKKEYYKEYNKKYYQINKEHKKEYYQINKEYCKEYSKKYYQINKEYYKEHYKEYYKSNPDIFFNARIKRRTLEENQGNGITKEQWQEMMQFFNWECAYSGECIGGEKHSFIRSVDHIEPLTKGGDHEIWNCVPMVRGYNSSKNNKNMLEWYKEQPFYSEERLNKIYEWQEYAYDKWK